LIANELDGLSLDFQVSGFIDVRVRGARRAAAA